MSWHHGRLAAYDLETTGVDMETARIVTASLTLVGGGQPTQATLWLADPGIEIPEQATAVHGITTERARAEGAPAAEVVAQIVAALADVVAAGIPVVAMNARYDLTVIDREARRHGVPSVAESAGLRVVDPYVIDKQVDKYRKGSRKLTDLCSHYRVRIDEAHNAAADAVAAARVAWRQGQVYPQLAEMGLDRLHTEQRSWAAEQAASLQEYLRRTDPEAVVAPEWPLIPAAAEGGAS